MFVLDTAADVDGTSFHGDTISAPFQLISKLLGGAPNGKGDLYKVSAEWLLADTETKLGVTVYDWKETSLYDSDNPSPAQLLEAGTVTWHVGAVSAAVSRKFINWLQSTRQL